MIRSHTIFVPSTGILYFYKHGTTAMRNIANFRPLYGDLIFLLYKLFSNTDLVIIFVPSTGILYFYVKFSDNTIRRTRIFVPSTGILYFYSHGVNYELRCAEFSSPLRGSYISTLILKTFIKRQKDFRPLYGDLIFLPSMSDSVTIQSAIFVPSTGILYFYPDCLFEE